MAKAGFGDYYSTTYQNMLPAWLRGFGTQNLPIGGKWAGSPAENIAMLWKNPGGINPNLSAAISPLMAQESDRIARTNRGQLAQAAGAGARTGTASSGIAQALERAIERAGSRDLANARRSAIGQSEQLRRQDMSSYVDLQKFLLDTQTQQRQLRVTGQAQQKQQQNQQTAAYLSAIAQIAAAYYTGGGSVAVAASDRNIKSDIEAVDEEDILRRLAELPVSAWSYNEEPGRPRHIGPMAQDFHAAFGLGGSDKSIAVVDAMGVLTAAVKALARRVEAR